MKDQAKTKKQLIEELEALRRQTKEANLHVHQEWEDIFQAIGHPTIILDTQHNVLSVNRATVKAAGAGSAEELIGRKCYEIFHNAGEPPKGCPLKKMLSSVKFEASEMEVEAFGGIFLVSCTPVFDDKGNLQKIIHIAIDITERKHAEEFLRESEERFSKIFRASPIAVSIARVSDGKLTEVNDVWCKLIGFSKEETVGRNLEELKIIDHEQRAKLREEFLSKGFLRLVESEITTKSGVKKSILTSAELITIKGDQFSINLLIDITERKRAEVALREKEHLLSESQRIAHIGSWDWDLTGPIKWTDETYRIYGVSPETFTPTIESLVSLLHPEDRPAMQLWLEACEAGQSPDDLEFRVILPDGSVHLLSGRGELIYDTENRPDYMAGTVQDITERKQAEEKIRKLNAELEQRVIERTAQLNAVNRELGNEITERKQREEKIKRQNILLEAINWIVREALTVETEEELSSQSLAIAEELTGSRFGFIDELNEAGTMDSMTLSNPDWEVCRMPHTDAAILLKNIPVRGIYADSIKKGISVIVNDPASHPDRVGLPEGHPPITAFLGVPLKQGEKVIGLIGLANKESGYDADDQQAIEMISVAFVEALTRIRSENLIKTLNKELEQSVAEVSHANKELEAFSYSVSHDLRAPLRAIDGFAEILLRDHEAKLDQEGKRILSIVVGNTKKMGQLIDELLSLSRLGRAEIHFSSIDVKEIAHAVYLELTTPEMRQQIDFQLGDINKATCDSVLIKQVWMNLISNAIKFSSHRERPAISITSKEEKDRVVYCVKDNGAGFNMQYTGKLFGVFQRLHSEEEFEGTGVGLAIVQRIVHRHGGTIWAEGEVDKGATFCFSIPI